MWMGTGQPEAKGREADVVPKVAATVKVVVVVVVVSTVVGEGGNAHDQPAALSF